MNSRRVVETDWGFKDAMPGFDAISTAAAVESARSLRRIAYSLGSLPAILDELRRINRQLDRRTVEGRRNK